jgi:hypothetical protein
MSLTTATLRPDRSGNVTARHRTLRQAPKGAAVVLAAREIASCRDPQRDEDLIDVHLSADHLQRTLGLSPAMGVGGFAHVDPLDLADVGLGPQLERGVDSGVRRRREGNARMPDEIRSLFLEGSDLSPWLVSGGSARPA